MIFIICRIFLFWLKRFDNNDIMQLTITRACISCRKQVYTIISFLYFPKKSSSLSRMGPITSSLRRMIFACLDEIFSSADPIPPLNLYPASLKIHNTPIPRTLCQLIQSVVYGRFDSTRASHFSVCLLVLFITYANGMGNTNHQNNIEGHRTKGESV